MNRVKLEQLLKECVKKVNESETALSQLDNFCEKQWHATFSELQSDMDVQGDHIVEWLMCGNGSADIDAFIKFMNEYTDKREDRVT